MTFPMLLRRAARLWGDRPAVLHRDRALGFRGLDERSSRLANALTGLGLRKGDRVAVQSRNCIEMVEVECALYKSGLVKVAINPRFTEAETHEVVAGCEPRVFIAGQGFAGATPATPGFESVERFVAVGERMAGYLDYEALLAAASDRAPEVSMAEQDLAVLHFSSGSTGRIKAAMQSYGNRLAAFRKMRMGFETVPAPGDLLALVGPVTHASGMLMQPFLSLGATLVLFDKFDAPHYLAELQRLRITDAFLVPAMLNMLLAEPALDSTDLSSLRRVTYGAAPMAPARIQEAWERIGPVLTQGYGASESTSGVARLSTADHAEAIRSRPQRLASCGRPYAESEVRVVDAEGLEVEGDAIGEIVIRGPDVFQGYWRSPDATREVLRDGWLHTGDLARVDEEGYLYIVDRQKDMIISGGFNVYPNEVENVLYQHQDVHEACVIGVPHPVWGEAVKAVVALKPGAPIDAAGIVAHCRSRVADYKVPRSVEFVEELPKNASGKLSRKLVREPYWAGSERRVNG